MILKYAIIEEIFRHFQCFLMCIVEKIKDHRFKVGIFYFYERFSKQKTIVPQFKNVSSSSVEKTERLMFSNTPIVTNG